MSHFEISDFQGFAQISSSIAENNKEIKELRKRIEELEKIVKKDDSLKNELKLEVGKFYKDNEGNKWIILYEDNYRNRPFGAAQLGCNWADWFSMDGICSDMETILISEWED